MPREGFDGAQRPNTLDTLDLTHSPPSDRRQSLPLDGPPPHFPSFPDNLTRRDSSHRHSYPLPPPPHSYATGANALGQVTSHHFPPAHEQPHHPPPPSASTSGYVSHLVPGFRNQPPTPQHYQSSRLPLPKQSPALAQSPLQPAPPGHYPHLHQHQHPRAGNDYQPVGQPYQYSSHSHSQQRSSTTPGLQHAASGDVRGVFLKQQTKYLYASRVDQGPSPHTSAIAGGRTHQVPTYGVTSVSSSSSSTLQSQQRAQSSASRIPQKYRTSHSPPRDSPPSASIPFGLPPSAASAPRAEQSQSSKSRVIDILDDEDESTPAPAPAHISEQAPAQQLFPSGEIDDDEMSWRKPTLITPRDPSATPTAIPGMGWTSGGGLYPNEDPPSRGSSAAAKGKGKGKARPSYNFERTPGLQAALSNSVSTANKGGGRPTQKDAINSMARIPKTGRDSHSLGTISATAFHQHQPAASTSSAAARQPYKPVMPQDAPLTAQEKEGLRRQAEVARSMNGAGKGKGKGKEKASAAVMELSSDEDGDDRIVLVGRTHQDEDPNDPIIDDDDRRTANGVQRDNRRHSMPHSSTSRTPKKSKARHSLHDARFDESQEPTSPDPLAIDGLPKDRAHLGKLHDGRAFANQAVQGRVKTLVAGIEEKSRGGQAVSLVQQMKGKQPQRRQHDPDGGPTDDGEIDVRKVTKKPPRASQQAQTDVCAVKVEPYMLGRRAFAAEHFYSKYSLILNCRGNPKGWKLALHRHPPQQEYEEVCSDIKAEHLQSIDWSISQDDERRPYVFLQFNSGKGRKVVEVLAADCEDAGTDSTVLFILEDAPQSGWQDDSIAGQPTQESLFFQGLSEWGRRLNVPFTQSSGGKAGGLCDLYRRAHSETASLMGKMKRGGVKGKKPSGRNALDPQQSKLSFVAAASTSPTTRRLVQDEDGDLLEAMQRSLKDQGGRPDDDDLEIMTDQATASRRSTRPSTSNLASSSRNEAAAVNRRSSTQAAPKSPSPQPMSEEERKWDEWWKAEDKTHKAEQIVVEYPINQPGGVSLPWADIKRLKPNEFLNDTLIEFGLKHAMQEVMKADESRPDDEKLAPKIHLFNSFFYSQLSTRKDKKNDPYALVEKWTKKVDIFDKRFIVVPINEHFHWYLAIIYNPAAILREHDKPPPPEPRQSGRKRTSIAGSESVSASPSVSRAESPEQTSRHFDKKAEGAADVEMQDGEVANGDGDAQVQDEIEEEQEQRHRRGIEEEVRQIEARKQSLQAEPAAEHEAEPAQRDKMSVEPSSRQEEATEMQVDGSPELGEAPAPADAMAVDAEEADIEVTAPRPEVEGGGRKLSTSAQEDRKGSASPPRGRLKRGTREGSVVIQEDAAPTPAQSRQAADDDDDLPAPEHLVKGAEPAVADSITIDDDESAPTQSQEVGATSAPMRKKRSGSSSTGTKAVSAAAAYAEPKPAASASKKRKAQQFGPADPEPNRAEDLKRKKEEEETQKLLDFSARVSSLVDGDEINMNKCYIFTFDSLGDAHAPVARRLKDYLIREAETKKGMDKEKLSDHLVETVRVEVPQQPNYCDCGLYLLHFVEVLFRDADQKVRQILAIHQANNGKRPRTDSALRQYRNEMWEFEAAQKKRTTMLEQVKELMEVWKRDVLPLREQAEREKEERRRKQKEEKEAKEAKEVAKRAEQDEVQQAATSQTAPAAGQEQDQPASDADADAPPPAQGSTSAPSRQQTPPPTPPAPAANTRSGKSRAKGKSKKSETEVLELSDDATCSTSGSPVKQSSQYFANLTPLKGDEPFERAEAGTPPGLPPPRRANAMNGDTAEASTSAAAQPAAITAASFEDETLVRPTLYGSAPSATVAGQKRRHDDRAAHDPEKPFGSATSLASSTSTSSAPPARPASAPINSSVANEALLALGGRLTVTQSDSPALPSASTSTSQVQPMQLDSPPLPGPDLAALADPYTVGDLPETQSTQASRTDGDGSQSPPRKKAKRTVAPAELDSRRVEESSGESQQDRARDAEGSQELFGPTEERAGAGELPPSNQQQATEEQPQQEEEVEEASASPSKKKGRGGGKGKKKGGKAGKAAEKKTAVVTLSDSEDDEGEK